MAAVLVLLSGCSEIQRPRTDAFFAETPPPAKQEFRWSNGKAPKSFDPARAAASPETDLVRSIFEGLTEIDSRTLKPVPAAAESWTSSDDLRVWTFNLRKDARWSNGKKVVADDFVSSWKRLATLGDKAAHPELFQNIVGLQTLKTVPAAPGEPIDFLRPQTPGSEPQPRSDLANAASAVRMQNPAQPARPSATPAAAPKSEPGKDAKPAAPKFGVEAVSETVLQITLELPDKDLPKLVASPTFRPVYGDGSEFDADPLDADVVTNGAFGVAAVGKDGIALDRSDTYWNKAAVHLEHVRFVPKDNAESALDAYKKGEIDAVTNADFEPLALKLLAPYEDFRQTTHSALNYYEINTANAPFNDRRVREALAISIDRERLVDGELEGSTVPATSFLPLGDKKNAKLSLDVERAKVGLEKAGYPNGAGFPVIRLLVNRNDTQVRVARVVARMWKQNLNLDTQISVKEPSEMQSARALGEYDLMRRGVVLPTTDEQVSMAAIFGPRKRDRELPPPVTANPDAGQRNGPSAEEVEKGPGDAPYGSGETPPPPAPEGLTTEEAAVFELNAIPLYFPMSYSLVKPYVKGFEINGLDGPLVRDISIDSGWQPRVP